MNTEYIYCTFNNYLKYLDISDKFKMEYEAGNIYKATEQSLESYLKEEISKERLYGIFVVSFAWNNTKDGFEYWQEISEKWQLFLQIMLELYEYFRS